MGLALGQGQAPLEVVVIEAATRPAITAMRAAWKDRHGGRAAPVLLIAVYGNSAAVCGPSGDNPPVLPNVELGQAERLCRTALEEPDRHSALRFLRPALEAIDSPMAGVRNEGLMSTHEIGVWLRENRDKANAKAKSKIALTKTGTQLVMALGFEVEQTLGPASILVSQSQKLALAVFLDRNESPDTANQRFSNFSPVTYALTKADQENLPYVIIANGPAIRIYPTNPGVGVGRRGRTETFLELHLDLLKEDHISLLWYLFSADALGADGTFEKMLGDSKDYATSLGERLRERVYQDAIPQLATALVAGQNFKSPTQQELDSTYHMALTLLFRILFIAYGEDKDLLPYRTNDLYRARSFKQKAREMVKIREEGIKFDTNSFDHWNDALRLFDAVNGGSQEFGVPKYNGGLFNKDPEESPIGAKLSSVRLSDNAFGPVLSHILLDDSQEGIGPVDFRSLGVRDFGTIYEGLLESELSVAETDLVVDKDGVYKPANGVEPQVRSGEVYIHNKSGTRKASGSYFTKAFAVDHLLDHSLEPALEEHTTRLGMLDAVEAGKAFFDFRVADIAMGSGHFLVAAVDRIERRLQQYLAERPLPTVTDELARLRHSAVAALGPLADGVEIEDTTLLRRQIARRCIYGVDLNPIAVELARVSLWIHTFVPGLPLSMLDHHLMEGNSLVGIGTMDEARELVSEEMGGPLFNFFVQNIVHIAAQRMSKVGKLADANDAEIQAAKEALGESRKGIDPLKAMFDILAASRLNADISKEVNKNVFGWQDKPDEIRGSDLYHRVVDAMGGIEPFHFPVAFPDVFARPRAGFDVILGNPPWDEIHVNADKFWSRYFPGHHSIPSAKRESARIHYANLRPELDIQLKREIYNTNLIRHSVINGPYKDIGRGVADYYKAFAWRFRSLLAEDGSFGVVLPRGAVSGASMADWRDQMMRTGMFRAITHLVNRGHWVFDDVHQQYRVNLVAYKAGTDSIETAVNGQYTNLASFNLSEQLDKFMLSRDELGEISPILAYPSLPRPGVESVFRKFLLHKRVSDPNRVDFQVSAGYDASASEANSLISQSSRSALSVSVIQGRSFHIWQPNYQPPQATVGSRLVEEFLQAKNKEPVLYKRPRLVYRKFGRSDDSRTFVVSTAPPNSLVKETAYYLMVNDGAPYAEMFLLGFLSSRIFDWYVRCLVDLHILPSLFSMFRIPETHAEDSRKRIANLAASITASKDDKLRNWMQDTGIPFIDLTEDQIDTSIDEINALSALLVGLTGDDVRVVFETFHIGWDYEDRLMNTLEHYRRLEAKA